MRKLLKINSQGFINAAVSVLVILSLVGFRTFDAVKTAELSAHKGKDVTIMSPCGADDDSLESVKVIDGIPDQPLDYYTAMLNSLPNKSGNLINNGDMSQINEETGDPIGFARVREGDGIQSSFVTVEGEGFLRASVTDAVLSKTGYPSWITDGVYALPGHTYVYSFEYRSDAGATLNTELTSAANQISSSIAESLSSTPAWKTYTGYYRAKDDSLLLSLALTPAGVGSVDSKNYKVWETLDAGLNTGMVSVAFDDGWQSVYDNALPVLNSHGFKSTQYVISEYLDAVNSGRRYMSSKEVRKLAEEGHEIASHSSLHCDMSKLEPANVVSDTEGSIERIEKIRTPVTSYAYPYGHYNNLTQSIMTKEFKFVRTSDVGENDLYFDSGNIRSYSVDESMSDEVFQNILDSAVKNKTWIVLTYHHVDKDGSYGVSAAKFGRQMDAVKSSNLPVVTVSRGGALVKAQLQAKLNLAN